MVSLRSVLGEPDTRSWVRVLAGRTPRVVLGVVVIAVGVVLGTGLGPTPDPPATVAAPPRPHHPRDGGAVAADATSSTSTSVAVRIWPIAELTVEGRQVTGEEGRFEIGAEGDVVAIGDWDCDRLPTPAVLRPSTGEVAVFDRWAGDSPEPARPVAVITGAVELEPADNCGELVVRGGADGARVVDTRPEAS